MQSSKITKQILLQGEGESIMKEVRFGVTITERHSSFLSLSTPLLYLGYGIPLPHFHSRKGPSSSSCSCLFSCGL